MASSAAAFLDATVTYVLSREWKDLLWIYVLRLHPTPHCSEHVRYSFFGWARAVPTSPECTTEATPAVLTACAVCMLLTGAPLNLAAQRAGLPHAPMMIGMCVGWAVGDAVDAWRTRLLTDSVSFHVAFAAGWSLVAVLLLSLEPFLLGIECGEGGGTRARCEALCRSGWELLSRSLSVTVVMAWAFASNVRLAKLEREARTHAHTLAPTHAAPSRASQKVIIAGLPPDQLGGPLHHRLLFLWAALLTMVLAALTTRLYALRHEYSLDVAFTSLSALPPPLGRHRVRVYQLAAAQQLLTLAERAAGGISGAAWCSSVFASSAAPSLWLAIKDGAAACAFTALGVLWLVLSPSARLTLSEAASSSRGAVEAYFVTNTFSFFAGWAWILLLRDLSALVGQQAVLRESRRSSVLGLTSLDRAELSAFGGQLGSIVLFGPVLSFLVYRARRCYADRAGVASSPKDAVELLPRRRPQGPGGFDEESE